MAKWRKEQYKYSEIAVDPEKLAGFGAPDLESEIEKETRDSYREELVAIIKEIIDNHATDRQRQCYEMVVLGGMTQLAAAQELGLNQSSIFKALNGNHDYHADKKYGGLYPKIRKKIKDNKRAEELVGLLRGRV